MRPKRAVELARELSPELSIDELVIHGRSPAEAAVIAEAIERELTRLIPALASSRFAAPNAPPRAVSLTRVPVDWDEDPARVGAQIAGQIAGQIAKQLS